jgi:hypothetical protein
MGQMKRLQPRQTAMERPRPPLSLLAYAGTLAAAAAGAITLSFLGPLAASALVGPLDAVPAALLAPVMAALVALAGLFPIPLGPKTKVSVNAAPQFAAVLLFGAPLGPLAAATGVAINNAVLWARGRRHPIDLLLNAAEAAVTATLVATVVRVVSERMPGPGAVLLPAGAAAAAMYLTNIALINGAVAITLRAPFWSLCWATGRAVAVQHAGLYLLGLLAALNAPQHPWVPLLVALPTAVVYFSFRANQRLRTQTREAVEALADMVDLRDPYTAGHCRRVADLSEQLARRLRLPADEVELIRSAARVHDVGKIGVPDHVLRKPGQLDAGEWVHMRAHAEAGAALLARFPDYARGRELVLAHHERYDGMGYPRGAAGDRIPLGARIIAVADAYDAMTTDRPYRAGLAPAQAATELRRHRGAHWDPQVVDAFLALLVDQGVLAPAPERAADAAPEVLPRPAFALVAAPAA